VREGALGGEGGEQALEAPVQAILRTGVWAATWREGRSFRGEV